jgi:hypothetical protein
MGADCDSLRLIAALTHFSLIAAESSLSSIPQLVNLQLSVHKREQQLEAKAREVSDAS